MPLLIELNILFKNFSAKRREKKRLIEKSYNWFCISSDEQKTPEHRKWRSSSLRSEFVDLLWQHYQPTNVYIFLSLLCLKGREWGWERPQTAPACRIILQCSWHMCLQRDLAALCLPLFHKHCCGDVLLIPQQMFTPSIIFPLLFSIFHCQNKSHFSLNEYNKRGTR